MVVCFASMYESLSAILSGDGYKRGEENYYRKYILISEILKYKKRYKILKSGDI